MSLPSCLRCVVGTILLGGTATAMSGQAKTDGQTQASVLSALASAPELAQQPINAAIEDGTVTLSGSVQNDAQRRRADELASMTPGVQRVIDEMTVNANAQASDTSAGDGGRVLMSDGSYAAPDPTYGGNQEQSSGTYAHLGASGDVPPANGPDTDPYGRPLSGQQRNSYPQPMNSYPQTVPYAQAPSGYYGRGQPMQSYNDAYSAGQPGGQAVTIPAGTVLRVRVNQHLSSRDVGVGTAFDAMVVNDIVASGQVAVPRGAFVQGTVVEDRRAGHLTGRGELGLQLDRITLGGASYPLASDLYTAHGGDKTIQSVNSVAGLGALGAIFGAFAGGGAGAAIGAGVGGAAGLGASAASGRGDVFIPSEVVLTFRLTQPALVTTVSQAEMQRLAYGVPVGGDPRPLVVRRYPYPYYGGPVFYPRYYRPYGYYRY